MSTRLAPIRLAMREEGDKVNVYLAQRHTMEGAKLVASFDRGFAYLPGVREHLMELLQTATRSMWEAATGVPVRDIDVSEAPAHERPGHA